MRLGAGSNGPRLWLQSATGSKITRNNAMGLRTPLYDSHLATGARMVDFGGWDMPLHYGSQIEEHHQVRREAGIFDVSHMGVVDITGADATAFLQYLLANDVGRLQAPGRALYAAMLNPDGASSTTSSSTAWPTATGWWSMPVPASVIWNGSAARLPGVRSR